MGRHTSDPHAFGRYALVGGGLLLLVALLVVGAFALYRALP